jgi:prepilin-type N-terminal cleavage/methylation domain-containing protein
MEQKQKGFTLIEIVIVLAIAALVLAGVLIAVSGAQKSRRDTQRKDDVGKIASYLEQYASNNNGDSPPADGTGFNGNYGQNLKDPSSGDVYTIGTTDDRTAGQIQYLPGVDCAGADSGSRVYALKYTLEQGGTYCTTNK